MDGEIDPEDVETLLAGDVDEDEDVRVVDIRPRDAFEAGHLPDSECIPFAALPREVDRLDGAERVVTVCPHGEASVRAARIVASYGGIAEGARVESMAGGLTAWEGALETGRGSDLETGQDSADRGEADRDGDAPDGDAPDGGAPDGSDAAPF